VVRIGHHCSGWARDSGATRYCPINQATGRDTYGDESPLEEGLRDTQTRRHTAMRGALGTAPTTESGQPRVTPESDVFGRTQEPTRS
jgi:hypothetical protein